MRLRKAAKICCCCFPWLWDLIRPYLRFSKAAIFISALGFGDAFVDNAFKAFLISYIPDHWKEPSLRKAAAIVNAFHGGVFSSSVVLWWIAFYQIGIYKVLIGSIPVMITGLLLLWLTEWFYVHDITIRLFHIGFVCLTIGAAGCAVACRFLFNQFQEPIPETDEKSSADDDHAQEQGSNTDANSTANDQSLQEKNPDMDAKANKESVSLSQKEKSLEEEEKGKEKEERTIEICSNVWWYPFVALGSITASTFTSSLTWKNTLMVSSIVMGGAYLFFCSGTCFYKGLEKPEKISFLSVFKKAKPLLSLLPLWTVFIVYSLVDAAGYTFFMEQSSRLDDRIDIRIPVYNHTFNRIPLTSIYLLQTFTSFTVSLGTDFVIYDRWNESIEQRARFWRIGIGLLFASGSCMMARGVEIRRLRFIKELGITDYADDRILPMKVLWLAPQFFLLGIAKGLVGKGHRSFFYDRVRLRKGMKDYESPCKAMMLGIGRFVAAVLILILRNWIADNMDVSHLDKYYLMLAIVSVVALIGYTFLSYKFDWNLKFKEADQDEESQAAMGVAELLERKSNSKDIVINVSSAVSTSEATLDGTESHPQHSVTRGSMEEGDELSERKSKYEDIVRNVSSAASTCQATLDGTECQPQHSMTQRSMEGEDELSVRKSNSEEVNALAASASKAASDNTEGYPQHSMTHRSSVDQGEITMSNSPKSKSFDNHPRPA